MLHLATLAPSTLDLLKRIQGQDAFKDTRLVGGAALALHYGHRTSMDLDLFGSWKPQPPLELVLSGCANRVMKVGGTEALQFFTVEDVKIDCVTYPYKWLRPAVEADGVRLADIPDIAAMKLAAVTNRGTRKDFVDVYFLLQHHSLQQLLDWYAEKYPDGNDYLVLRSLVYFDDAELDPMPNMLEPVTWAEIRQTIELAVKQFA